jgi:hypothetical protein
MEPQAPNQDSSVVASSVTAEMGNITLHKRRSVIFFTHTDLPKTMSEESQYSRKLNSGT